MVNQLNNKLDVIYALIVIVMIGVLHVQLSEDGAHIAPPALTTVRNLPA